MLTGLQPKVRDFQGSCATSYCPIDDQDYFDSHRRIRYVCVNADKTRTSFDILHCLTEVSRYTGSPMLLE